MNNAELNNLRIATAERKRKQRLLAERKFVEQLEKFAWNTEACPFPEFLPFLLPYRLLKGNAEEVQEFLRIVFDESDPRQNDFQIVLDAVEQVTVENAMLGMRSIGITEAGGQPLENMLDFQLS